MFVRNESFKGFLRAYPVVSTIVVINIVLFLLCTFPLSPFSNIENALLGVNFAIYQGEYWRWVTSIFLHVSFSHILFNMFTLIIIGPAAERILKPTRFLFIYFASGVGANIIAYFIKPLGYAYLGASGAIFGLLGFFIFCVIKRPYMFSYHNKRTIQGFAIISLIMTFLTPNVGIIAHLGGFALGFITANALLAKRS